MSEELYVKRFDKASGCWVYDPINPPGDAAVLTDLRDISDDIQEWLKKVYPGRHPDKVYEKLLDELEELKERPTDAWEWADVLILILDLMHMYGIDPAKAIHWKMDINKKREWEFKDGKLKHLSTNPAPVVQSRERGPVADSPDGEEANTGGTQLHDSNAVPLGM